MTIRYRRSLRLWSVILLATMGAQAASAADLFVDANLSTGANDGSSWADAFQGTDGLQAALAVAVPGDRVFVAQGTYRPDASGNRNATFLLSSGIALYGGCAGTETDPAERPVGGSAPSILTGDLNGDDPMSLIDNSINVVRASGTLPTGVLDRFVVTGGYADGSLPFGGRGGGLLCDNGARPTVRDCRFEGNVAVDNAGAVYATQQSRPLLSGCSFVDNISGSSGGGLYASSGGAIRVERCDFRGNVASDGGGVALSFASGTTLTECTFFGNVAFGSAGGGAISLFGSSSVNIRGCTIVGNESVVAGGGGVSASTTSTATIRNSIVWGNFGPLATQTYESQVDGISLGSINYSIVQGIPGVGGNLDLDPMLVDAIGGDLRLTIGSPAIDAGNNGAVSIPPGAELVLDHDGFRRFEDEPTVPDTGIGPAPVVDIGAFEYTTVLGRPYCVAQANTSGVPARIDALGSNVVADNMLTLRVIDAPPGASGYFLTSRIPGENVLPNGFTLCLAGNVGRFDQPGQVMQVDASGAFSLTIDLTTHPTRTGTVAVLAGETWRYQAWFRDTVLGFPASNVSDAIAVTFE